MVWYELLKFFALFVAEEADEVLHVSWIVLLLAHVVALHAERQSKANLVQIKLFIEVKNVLFDKLCDLGIISFYHLNHFD